jgi:hypothetical protein
MGRRVEGSCELYDLAESFRILVLCISVRGVYIA